MDVETQLLIQKLVRQSGGVVNECEGQSVKLRTCLFDKQVEILDDKSKYKLLNLGRRSSKTFLSSVALTIPCLDTPGIETLYLSITKASAKAIIWQDLRNLLDENGIQYAPNSVEAHITFPNKSRIIISGANTLRDAEHLRGKKYRKIVIDEAAFFSDVLSYVVDDALRPTLTDYADSELWLTSTPNSSMTGYFYNEYVDPDSKFKKWHFDYRSNPKMPRWAGKTNWQEIANKVFEEERAAYEREGKINKFNREYLAQWMRDTESLLFPTLHTTDELPDNLTYWIGVDIGYNDETAIVVVGIDLDTQIPTAYLVDSYSESQVLTSDLAIVLRKFSEKYEPVTISADSGGGGKRLIEDVNAMYGLNIQAADKPKNRKAIDIEMLSDLARRDRFMVHKTNIKAFNELSIIQWDSNRQPDGRFADHILDALIYSFRDWMQYFSENEEKKPTEPINPLEDSWKAELIQRIKNKQYAEDYLFGTEEIF